MYKRQHINIPSKQVPTRDKVDKFLKTLDSSDAYPVLIHCYHGTGRAELYSAIYRMEFEDWSNQNAREQTRLVLKGLGYESSFALGKGKGDYLNAYLTRDKLNANFANRSKSIEGIGENIVLLQK